MEHGINNFKVGDTFYLQLDWGKPYKCHVLAIVDEEYIVYKWYGKHKQWWHYNIEDYCSLSWKIERCKESMK